MRTKLVRIFRKQDGIYREQDGFGHGFSLLKEPKRHSSYMAEIPDAAIVFPVWEKPIFFHTTDSPGRYLKVIHGENIGYINGDVIEKIFVLTENKETGEIVESLLWNA